MKKAKITIEFDGQKTVFTTDSFNMRQSRDVKRKVDFNTPGKTKFEPGDSTLVLVAFRPMLIAEECSPIPTIEKAFGIASPDQAQAIQESRRGMVSDRPLKDKEGVDWDEALEEMSRLPGKYMQGTIGAILGNWQIMRWESNGSMFTVRVKNTKTGTVIDVEKHRRMWREKGVLATINQAAEEGGIVV